MRVFVTAAAQSETWWTALVLGRENDAVNPQDAFFSAGICCLPSRACASQYRNSVMESVTVGQLHETVEALYGAPGWVALVEGWHEAAGIEQPQRQPKIDCALIPAAEPDGKASTPLPPLPADAPLLEEGLHQALPGMPEKVAAFLLHTPKDSPPWRYVESEGERAERQALENLGAWTG
jgi:hypothetical protein